MAFKFLRRIFGEAGRVADWTRTWAGPWRCVILATGQSAVFESREEAICWEIEVLTALPDDVSIDALA